MKRLLLGLAVLLLVITAAVLQLLWAAGEFKTLVPHFDGSCAPIGGLVGAEDLTIHPRTGVAYLSAYDRRAAQAGGPAAGAIYAYDLREEQPELVRLTPDSGADFRPHGISLFTGADGRDTLFAINHASGRHTIEIYDLLDGQLRHRKTLADAALVSPNDLVGVSHDRVYVTNDHRYTGGFMQVLENFLRLRLANVVYYDGSRFSEAAPGIATANGINVSANGRSLYVNSLLGGTLFVFDRIAATGALSLRESIPLGSSGDNIEVDPNGWLWIGAHPQVMRVLQHARDAANHSPSQLLRVSWLADGSHDISEVYLDLGDNLSAASVGAARGSRLLIGAIFEPKFLDCRLN